jgi:glycopeptide antibiotics resistance protein
MSDLLLNILGTLAGILIYKKLVRDHETGHAKSGGPLIK